MNDVINEIFAMGTRIRDSGLTPAWLVFIGVLFGATLVLSIREMSQWYLGVHRLRKDLKEIRHSLSLIQAQLASRSALPTSSETSKVHDLEFVESAPVEKAPFSGKPANLSQSFPLQR